MMRKRRGLGLVPAFLTGFSANAPSGVEVRSYEGADEALARGLWQEDEAEPLDSALRQANHKRRLARNQLLSVFLQPVTGLEQELGGLNPGAHRPALIIGRLLRQTKSGDREAAMEGLVEAKEIIDWLTIAIAVLAISVLAVATLLLEGQLHTS